MTSKLAWGIQTGLFLTMVDDQNMPPLSLSSRSAFSETNVGSKKCMRLFPRRISSRYIGLVSLGERLLDALLLAFLPDAFTL